MIATLLEGMVALMLLAGGGFALVGSYGLLSLPQPMQRLHAPTKATTIGVGTTLVASAAGVLLAGQGLSLHEVLVAGFLLIAAPVSALFMAKVHLFLTVDPATLPPTGTDRPWATLAPDHPPAPAESGPGHGNF